MKLAERLRASTTKMVGAAQSHCNDVEAVHQAADEIELLNRTLMALYNAAIGVNMPDCRALREAKEVLMRAV